jgi:hypothetical protein
MTPIVAAAQMAHEEGIPHHATQFDVGVFVAALTSILVAAAALSYFRKRRKR